MSHFDTVLFFKVTISFCFIELRNSCRCFMSVLSMSGKNKKLS